MWANYMHWLHGLPMWGQVLITSFEWSLAATLPLAFLAHRYRLRSGRSFDPKRWHIVAFFVVAFYVRNSTAWGREAATWPDRYVPHWSDYWLCIALAALLAAFIAHKLGGGLAVWRARGSQSQPLPEDDGASEFYPMADPEGFSEWRDQ